MLGSTSAWSTLGSTGGGPFQGFQSNTPYTLTYEVRRLDASNTEIFAQYSGGGFVGYSFTQVDNSDVLSSFDMFAIRVSGSANVGTQIAIDSLQIATTAAYDVVPEPSTLLLLAAGGLAFVWWRRRQR